MENDFPPVLPGRLGVMRVLLGGCSKLALGITVGHKGEEIPWEVRVQTI